MHRLQQNIWRGLVLLLSIFLLASCGFQPRGLASLSPPLQKIYIKTTDPYGQLARSLHDYLQMSGAQVTQSSREATTVLDILSDTESQQLVSVSGTLQTRQYILMIAVTFQLTDSHGIIVVPPGTLSESRAFTTLSDQILGGTNEQTTLYKQMRQAMVYDIINRLGSHEITTVLMNHNIQP